VTGSFGDVTAVAGGDGVGVVEMHRPPPNYFDAGLLGGIVAAIAWANGQGCRAIVLCSEGRHVCAGLDFGATGTPTPESLGELYGRAVELMEGPLPVVVALQGAAIGGGLGLALAGDFRVASDTSRFEANFARLGFHQGFGLSVTLPRVVGHQRASELLTTGRRVGGQEAMAIGLCDRLSGDPRAGAHALAAEIAGSAPLAVRSIRSTLRAGLTEQFADALRHEGAEQLRLMQTEDFREGIGASQQRRPPRFSGR
jgi:2-(1,2-epoxy-1,2-dihydrophenyl)acetyl-CoA isomerase